MCCYNHIMNFVVFWLKKTHPISIKEKIRAEFFWCFYYCRHVTIWENRWDDELPVSFRVRFCHYNLDWIFWQEITLTPFRKVNTVFICDVWQGTHHKETVMVMEKWVEKRNLLAFRKSICLNLLRYVVFVFLLSNNRHTWMLRMMRLLALSVVRNWMYHRLHVINSICKKFFKCWTFQGFCEQHRLISFLKLDLTDFLNVGRMKYHHFMSTTASNYLLHGIGVSSWTFTFHF